MMSQSSKPFEKRAPSGDDCRHRHEHQLFIECAVAGQADYLATGDKSHLLKLKHAGGIPVVPASEFLRLLGTPANLA